MGKETVFPIDRNRDFISRRVISFDELRIENMNITHKYKMNIVQGALVIGFSLFIIYLTLTSFIEDEFSMGGSFASATFYPQLIAGVMIFLSILLIVTALIPNKKESTSVSERKKAAVVDKKADSNNLPAGRKMFWGPAIFLVLYTFCLDKFGYILTTPVFMGALFWSLEIRRWKTIVLLSIVSSGIVYILFSVGLDVLFPQGAYLQMLR